MTMLRGRKSPQGRQVPSAFLTMFRGDDQGLSDRRTIPSFSSCRNSALAAANFSASSRWKREAMGGPEVLMWCSTSVPTGGRTLEGQTTSSNSAKNAFNHSGDSGGGAAGPAAPAAVSPPQRPVDPETAVAGRRWLRRRRRLPHSALWTPETVVTGRRWLRRRRLPGPSQKTARMPYLPGGWRRGRPTACGCAKNRPQ